MIVTVPVRSLRQRYRRLKKLAGSPEWDKVVRKLLPTNRRPSPLDWVAAAEQATRIFNAAQWLENAQWVNTVPLSRTKKAS